MTPVAMEQGRHGAHKGWRPAPLVPIAIGLITGIVVDNTYELAPAFVIVVTIGLLFIALLVFRRHHRLLTVVCIALFAAATGAVRHAVCMRYLPDNHIARFVADEPRIHSVTGRIITAPHIIERPRDVVVAYPTQPRTRFVLDVDSIEGDSGPISVTGKLHVSVKEPMPFVHLGDEVRITGRLYAPMPPGNPGMYDWSLLQKREGIHAALSTDHAAAVVTIAHAGAGRFARFIASARNRAQQYLLSDAVIESDPAAGVLSAMVLGQRSQVDKALNEAFVRTGAAHFLAASGLHVGWLALLGWWFARLFGRSNRQCAVIVALLIVCYVLLAEPRPSIMRAGALGVLACFGIYRAGRANTPNWLAAAAILLLMLNPTDVFRPAFQFSFAAVLSIVYFRPVIDAAMTRRVRAFRRLDALDAAVDSATPIPLTPKLPRKRELISHTLLRAVRLTLTASIAVWLANVPLACYHFNRFAPLGWLYNLLLWIPAFGVTALGFLKVSLALVFPSSVILTGPLLRLSINGFLDLVRTLASIPGGLLSGNNPSLAWVICVYAVISLRIWRAEWFEHRWRTISVYAILVAWWLVPARWIRTDTGALNVWMLAVGDGTAAVIELPDGRTMLFDCGTRSPFDASVTMKAFLGNRAIQEIDTAFVTHANFDHYGAIEPVSRTVPIRRLVIADQFGRFVDEGDGAWRFLKTMRESGVQLDTLDGPRTWRDPSGVHFEVLAPQSASIGLAPTANDSSLALRLTYQGNSILLTGDQAEWGLGHMLADHNIHADALILPHHGSVVHNTRAFVEAVDPTFAVRSTGQRHSLTTNGIETLVGHGRTYLSTADDGCIRLRIKNHKLVVVPFIKN